ncbi:MAG: hypothetical protein ACRDGV_05480 [Candidatus Limnocylindria bacterium]
MYDYRLFFANTTLDEKDRPRRRTIGQEVDKRIYQLPRDRRTVRESGRR